MTLSESSHHDLPSYGENPFRQWTGEWSLSIGQRITKFLAMKAITLRMAEI